MATKTIYFVADVINAKGMHYPYAVKIKEGDNLVEKLSRIKGLHTAELKLTKKAAFELVHELRAKYKEQGLYAYDD